jgi:co-chaperonin GroES (HSP10)
MENKFKNIFVIGDKVLIKPKSLDDRTKAGLYLPPGVQQREEVQSGYIIKVGPGYAMPQAADDFSESWKGSEEKVKYIPLQVKEGDLAIFLQKGAIEVMYEEEKYYIVPQHLILMIVRDEELFQ